MAEAARVRIARQTDILATHSFNLSQYFSQGGTESSSAPSTNGSGHQSGEPQSRSMCTSSTCSKYARGTVRCVRAAPERGVKVIISGEQ